MPDQEIPQLLSVEQVTTRLGITERHVRRLVAERPMPCLEVGKLSAVSLLSDAGASIEEVAHVLGDDPRTLYRRDRRRVRPVADVATRMEALLAGIAPDPSRTWRARRGISGPPPPLPGGRGPAQRWWA